LRLCVLATVVLLAGGCGGDDTAATTTPGGEGGGGVIIDNRTFMPDNLTVAAGTEVTWTNRQGIAHTVTADDGRFDSLNLSEGATFTMTFDTAGTFAYHCTIHPTMTATITIEG